MNFRDATFQDVLDDPNKYGVPTFEEFKRNPEKWLGKDDDIFSSADASFSNKDMRKFVKKHIYEIEGYKCSSLHEVEKIAKDHDIPIKELDYRPEMIPQGGGKWDVKVRFVPKKTL